MKATKYPEILFGDYQKQAMYDALREIEFTLRDKTKNYPFAEREGWIWNIALEALEKISSN